MYWQVDCQSGSLSICLSIYLSVCPSVCGIQGVISQYFTKGTTPSNYQEGVGAVPSIRLSPHGTAVCNTLQYTAAYCNSVASCLSVYLSVRLSVCLSVCLVVKQSVYVTIRQHICLSVGYRGSYPNIVQRERHPLNAKRVCVPCHSSIRWQQF